MLVHIGVPEGEPVPEIGDFVTATVTHAGRHNLHCRSRRGRPARPMPSRALRAGAILTQRVVSIVGPTASGKTGLGIAIARRLAEAGERAEIVNADAYQMYRGMDIGTAKPTAEEQAAVPHHLIDIIDPEDTMTVARFQQLARETIADLQVTWQSGRSSSAAPACTPEPPSTTSPSPAPIPTCATRLEEREKTEGAGALFDELRAKDPEAAARMDPRNPRRTIRALEVIEADRQDRIRPVCRATGT